MTATQHTAPPVSAAPVVRTPPSRWASLRAYMARALRDRRRAPLTWGLPLAAMCALEVALYPSIEGTLDQTLENYPEGIKEAFGIGELNSVEKFLDAEMFSLIVPLAIAFFAVRSIARAVAVPEENGHLDTLLATPLSRRTLVAGAVAVTAIVTAVLLAVVYAGSMLAGVAAGTGISAVTIAEGVVNVWPLAMFFAGIALLATGVMHRAAPVTGVAAGTLIAMYVIDLVGKLSDPAEPFRALSVFKYYGSAIQDGLDPLAFAGVTAAALLLAAAGALLFERRDVTG
jgi:ABC-2 type transport system permease protein